MRRLLAIFLSAFVVLGASAPAWADKRVALVIGNGAYRHVAPLPNPVNDARAIGEALARLGFAAQIETDLTQLDFDRALRKFAQALTGADVALLFYAGHGLQVQGRNFLAPIDAKLETETDLEFEVTDINKVMRILERESRINLVFLDACRDNPLARNLSRAMGATRSSAIGRGLARIDSGLGTLIAYSTEPDNVAADGDAANSPFTQSLLRHIEAPGLEVRQILTKVRQDVVEQSKGKQVPWDHSSLTVEFYFRAGVAAKVDPAATGTARDQAVWAAIQGSSSVTDFQTFVDQYPDSPLAPFARARIEQLRAAQPPKPQQQAALIPPPPPPPVAPPDLNQQKRAEALAKVTQLPNAWIQWALKGTGHYNGAIDGDNGITTKRAIRRYQAWVDAQETGALTPEQTVHLIRTAAEKGQAESQVALGVMLAAGVGEPKDEATALIWFRKAADQGNPHARYNLGVMLRDGRGAAANREEAARLFRLAQQGGYAEADKALRELSK